MKLKRRDAADEDARIARRAARKAARLTARLSAMSPAERERFEKRKAAREARRAGKLAMAVVGEERKEGEVRVHKDTKKAKWALLRLALNPARADRIARKAARLAAMTPEERAKHERRDAARAERVSRRAARLAAMSPEEKAKGEARKAAREASRAVKLAMSPEERAAVKEAKRKAAVERKEKWEYLQANWSTRVPENVATLIVDGNNLRGGGPQRLSRTAITAHVTQAVRACPSLHSAEVICFFDHAPGNHGDAEGMRVIYSGDTIADDKIVELVASFGAERARQTCVVTCDRGLALRLMALGARVMKNKVFNELNPNAPKAYGRSH